MLTRTLSVRFAMFASLAIAVFAASVWSYCAASQIRRPNRRSLTPATRAARLRTPSFSSTAKIYRTGSAPMEKARLNGK
jgi:hypothetical protein